MKINILTNGTRGDIQPLIYLARGLERAGHETIITAGDNFRELILQSGLSHAPMPVNLQDYMNSPEGRDMVDRISGNPITYIKEMKKLMRQFSRETLDSYWTASRGMDMLLSTTGALGDVLIAEKLGIPLAEIQLQPLYPTKDFSYPLIPMALPFGWGRKASYFAVEKMLGGIFRRALSDWQKDQFGFRLKYKGGIFAERRRKSDLVIGGYSPLLIDRPADWPPKVHITGFLTPNRQVRDQVPDLHEDIEKFLNRGTAPIYIGFGSAPFPREERLYSSIKKLLDRSDIRIVFSIPWGKQKCPFRHERLLTIESAPHISLFPQMSGIIHHGGAGTLAMALKSAVPQALFPVNADQPFWSRRLFEKGLIPRPVSLKKISYSSLEAAVRYMGNPRLIEKTRDFSSLLSAEKGVEQAVRLISALERD